MPSHYHRHLQSPTPRGHTGQGRPQGEAPPAQAPGAEAREPTTGGMEIPEGEPVQGGADVQGAEATEIMGQELPEVRELLEVYGIPAPDDIDEVIERMIEGLGARLGDNMTPVPEAIVEPPNGIIYPYRFRQKALSLQPGLSETLQLFAGGVSPEGPSAASDPFREGFMEEPLEQEDPILSDDAEELAKFLLLE